MADMTLAQAAEITGVAYATLKKHGQRGHLRIKTVNGRVYVAEEDLEAYQASKGFGELHEKVMGQSLPTVAREAGNSIARMPAAVRAAVLDGMPTSKKAGSPDPYNKAIQSFPHQEPVPITSDDPHFNLEIGYQHAETPRWKRKSVSTWVLGKATWTFSPDPRGGPGTWIGGGSREGARLAPGFSPANPYSEYRPLAGSESVDRD